MSRKFIKNTLPPVVRNTIENTILQCIKESMSTRTHSLIDSKKDLVPFELIKIKALSSNKIDLEAYKIKIQKKNSTHKAEFHKQAICNLHEQFAPIQHYPDDLDKASLREFEDEQSKLAREQSSTELYCNFDRPIDNEVITKIKALLHPDIEKHFDLIKLFESFAHIPGFQPLFEMAIEHFYIDNYMLKKSNPGQIFELECAHHLLIMGNDPVIEFTPNYESELGTIEYDLETASGRLIECKLVEGVINRNQINKQAKLAVKLNKKFTLCIREKLSEDTKNWLKKQKIAFKDNLKETDNYL